MTASTVRLVSLLVLAILVTGCVSTALRITNQTGAGIHVYSGHTKKVTTIGAGLTSTVPHSSGKVVVISQQDEVWEYDNVKSFVDEATRSYKRVSLRLAIGADGGMILPTGRRIEPTQMVKRLP